MGEEGRKQVVPRALTLLPSQGRAIALNPFGDIPQERRPPGNWEVHMKWEGKSVGYRCSGMFFLSSRVRGGQRPRSTFMSSLPNTALPLRGRGRAGVDIRIFPCDHLIKDAGL